MSASLQEVVEQVVQAQAAATQPEAAAVVAIVASPSGVMSTSSSEASIVTLADDQPLATLPKPGHILALAPPFQPRAASFPGQFLPNSKATAAAIVRAPVAVAPVRSSLVGHARSVSMPAVPMAEVQGQSEGVQYDGAYEVLAAKYLKTPQLNCLSGDAPSPPSSPESVLFIEQTPSGGLPRHFLRRRGKSVAVAEKAQPAPVAEASEEGWAQWGSSLPRPIPALHGPASLPYARCPSGAEGTVIEEQSSLPSVIWGLDNNGEPGAVTQEHPAPPVGVRPGPRMYHNTPGNKDRRAIRGPRQQPHQQYKARQYISEPLHSAQQEVMRLNEMTFSAPAAAAVAARQALQEYSIPDTPAVYQPQGIEEEALLAQMRRQAAHKLDEQIKRPRGHTISVAQHTDLLTLLNANNTIEKRPVVIRNVSNPLLTPASLSTPVFSSPAFSPLSQEQREALQRRWESMQSPNTPASMVSSSSTSDQSPTSAELSQQLRRIVSALPAAERGHFTRQAVSLPVTPLLPSLPVTSFRSPGAHVSADGKTINVWEINNGKQQVQQQPTPQQHQPKTPHHKKGPASPSVSLSNARSIPISRLRTNSGGLAPVPEEPEQGSNQRPLPKNASTRMTPRTASRSSAATSWRKPSTPKVSAATNEPPTTTLVAQSKADVEPVAAEVPAVPEVRIRLPGGGKSKKLKPKEDKNKEDISALQLDAAPLVSVAV
ncbi:hypothetical protein AURDEDRAFT_181135 [Auricularia subglabra TFB-10046 SS5]|nr:hypothetical protein AURDEDRAFT_181135 [Auricularia subglabra TFB-10046 SS5]